MSYVDIAKPKFFVDHINNRLATGSAQNNNADVILHLIKWPLGVFYE